VSRKPPTEATDFKAAAPSFEELVKIRVQNRIIERFNGESEDDETYHSNPTSCTVPSPNVVLSSRFANKLSFITDDIVVTDSLYTATANIDGYGRDPFASWNILARTE
jgi:hypothetical protein